MVDVAANSSEGTSQIQPGRLDLTEVIHSIVSITKQLRLLASVLFAGLFASIVIAFAAFLIRAGRDPKSYDPGKDALPLLAALLAGYSIGLLYLWDRLYRRGMLLYEEISDELEWTHRSNRIKSVGPENDNSSNSITSNSIINTSRPDLDLRIKLRGFLDATRLPFVYTEHSALIYLFLNIASSVAIVASVLIYK
jgi:hypothetical protein